MLKKLQTRLTEVDTPLYLIPDPRSPSLAALTPSYKVVSHTRTHPYFYIPALWTGLGWLAINIGKPTKQVVRRQGQGMKMKGNTELKGKDEQKQTNKHS